jgi:ATP-dependent RNA helicase DeaD
MTMTSFDRAVPALAQALTQRGFTEPTAVQDAVLAPELRDADILVSAQTGSGKTVAFGLALAPTLLGDAERFEPAAAPLALVVAPTRELALQVRRELQWLYAPTGAIIASCVGGMDFRDERRTLQRGAHIVVGTPGRLRDHIERFSLDTSAFRAVVLDEADEMLDLGFRDDLEFILGAAPAERRTLMFSATVPRPIDTLAKRFQRDAVRVSTTTEREQHGDIEYRALTVAPRDREIAIVNVLRYYEAPTALVFCSTRAAVNRMTSRFTNRGFSVVALSGELSQNERTHALQAMRDGRARVCIATDVAARGIDLPNLELVIHADLPTNRESLLHRSGRTGRAGRKGVCVVIVPFNERRQAERLLASASIRAEWAPAPSIDEIAARDRDRILADPVLTEPVGESEMDFAREIASRYSAEQIAAAFLRQYRAGHTAPEELIDTTPEEPAEQTRSGRARAPRDSFTEGVWFSLSVGAKENAEARWLLPMLCRAGGLGKGDIGSIRVGAEETHVELAADSVDRFLATIGPERIVEKSIAVAPLQGPPMARDAVAPAKPRTPAGKSPYARKTPYKDRKPRDFDGDSRHPAVEGIEPDLSPQDRAAQREDSDFRRERTDGPKHERPQRTERFQQRKPVREKRTAEDSGKQGRPERSGKFGKSAGRGKPGEGFKRKKTPLKTTHFSARNKTKPAHTPDRPDYRDIDPSPARGDAPLKRNKPKKKNRPDS